MSAKDLLVDSHCHLDFHDFTQDRMSVWTQSQSLGVRIAVIPGVIPYDDPRDQREYIRGLYNTQARHEALSIREPKREDQKSVGSRLHNLGWHFTVGLHPWWIDQYFNGAREGRTIRDDLAFHERLGLSRSILLGKLEESLNANMGVNGCVGLGESGLDFNIASSKDIQLESLRIHLAVSAEKNLPVILHSVKAHAELIKAIKQFPGCRGVIHAFTGSYEIAAQYGQLGFALGVGGTITYERAKKTRDAIRRMPMTSLVLETDAPDMPLSGQQGHRNSPEYLPKIAQQLADLKSCSVSEIAEQTTKNSLQIFSIDQP